MLSKYEIRQCGVVEKLIRKRKSPDEQILYFVPIEETLNIIKRAHKFTHQGGRDHMLKKLGNKYANITRYAE